MIHTDTCDSGWAAHGCRCFKFFNTPKTWIEAEVRDGSSIGFLYLKEFQFANCRSSVRRKRVWPIMGTWRLSTPIRSTLSYRT